MSSDSPQRPADTLPGHAAAHPSLDQHMANSDVPEPAPTPHTGGAVPSFMTSLLPQVSIVNESPGRDFPTQWAVLCTCCRAHEA